MVADDDGVTGDYNGYTPSWVGSSMSPATYGGKTILQLINGNAVGVAGDWIIQLQGATNGSMWDRMEFISGGVLRGTISSSSFTFNGSTGTWSGYNTSSFYLNNGVTYTVNIY